jgi:hypothetical protein
MGSDRTRVDRALIAVLIVMLLAVGAHGSGRIETRYTFFLYPIVVVLCLRAVQVFAHDWFPLARKSGIVAIGTSLLLFSCSEDFQLRHIARIDSRQVNFRVGMGAEQSNHYYPRADYRFVGTWLEQQRRPGDTVILGIPTIDQYYHGGDLFFLQDQDPRFEVYACAAGDRERWTNLPLLHGMEALESRVAVGARLWLLMYIDQAEELVRDGQRRGWTISYERITPERNLAAVVINP